MYAHELFEAGKPQVVVTYPGRFQPFHQGHAGVFAKLQKKFGRDSVYILTSNDQSSAKSPFNFSDKYQLMSAAGVPGDRIIETNQMYKLPEGFDPASTIFITAVGAPDKDRLNPDTFTKRDQKDKDGNVTKPAGSPSYYKTWDESHAPMTADQHGYVIVVPEIHKEITINGKKYDVSHGTECRNLWNQVRNNPKSAKEFLVGLYGRATPELVTIFDKIPESVGEDIGQTDSNYSASPINGSRVFHEGIVGSILNKIKSVIAKYKLGAQVQNQKADLEQQYQELAREGEMILADPNTDPNTKFQIEQQLKILNNLASSNKLKESYEYRAPGASVAQTARVLNKMKPASKLVWKKPNQISGSFTDTDLVGKGFRKSEFGGWGGTEAMWNKLHGLDEVAMNPKAFAQSIAQGQSKGVMVGFEFEVCIPAASVEGRGTAPVAGAYNPDDNSWIDGKTVNDLLTRLRPPVTGYRWPEIFDDLFKNKTSVAQELGEKSVWDTYQKWVKEQVDNAAAQILSRAVAKAVKEILNDPDIARYQIQAEPSRDKPGGSAKDVFIQLLQQDGIDIVNLKPRAVTGELLSKLEPTARKLYYWTPGPIDQQFRELMNMPDTVKGKIEKGYIPQEYENERALQNPIANFAAFCEQVYGTTDLKELLRTKWAFKGRTNNATPVLKEKLWYYLTPGAQRPESLQRRSYNRGPDYKKGAEFLKNNLAPSFGDNITVFRGYHQETKKLDRWYIEPDGSLRPNDSDYSAEVVSPPLLANDAMTALKTFYQKAQDMNLYTNSSTGLHINVSIPDKLDVLKLAMFVGDQYVLKSFGRENNNYARSVIKSLQSGRAPVLTGENLATAEKDLKQIAGNISGDHFATVNFNGKYVSFRHAGGDYLNKMPEIINTVGRFIRAMIIAADPNAYRSEYLSKLMKMFGAKTAEPAKGMDSAELQKMIKTGIPTVTFDAALRPGFNDPNSLVVGASQHVIGRVGGPVESVTAMIKPDPSARQRLLSSEGWGVPTKEHLTTAPDNIFYVVTVVPTSINGIEAIKTAGAGTQTRAQGLYDQNGNRAGVGIMHTSVLNRSNPEFNKIIAALRGRAVTGPKGVLPEDAAGVGVVAKNKKMAKDPRYSMSITKDVKPSTPKNMLRAFRLAEDFAAKINPADFEIKNFNKLDHILVNLCEMVVEGQRLNADAFGMVAACVLDPDNQFAFGINYLDDGKGKRIHAEHAAILNYEAEHGPVPAGSIIITTLSPCCHPMNDRYGDSCTEIINDTDCHKVYCGYKDPTQEEDMNKTFHVMQTRNAAIIKMCKTFARTFLGDVVNEAEENNHSVTEKDMMSMIKKFMPLAMKELKLKQVPHIVLQPHIESNDGQATFGRFVNEEEKIYLGIADRHPVDILRTLAHELVHFKQYEQGKMYPGAGDTGSPIENEAHWVAGIIMRHFNKKYPDAIKSKPLELSEEAVPTINYGIGRNPGKLVKVGADGQVPHAKLHVNVSNKTAKKLGLPHELNEAEEEKCPPATQDIKLNLKNRQKAIDEYGYGPLNPDLPNTKFWMKKVNEWNLDSVEEAQQSLCGNCAAFDIRQNTLDCIAQGIDSDSPQDAEVVIDAGDLGYCKFLKFKCASRRTCDAWVTGGPLTDQVDENLRDWFKEKWVRFGPDGKIRGDCARGDDSEGKPKCLPQAKAHALGKKGRASAAARKRREDPNPERHGAAINVATKKKTNEEICPECGGPMFSELLINEKKDACYYKVKSRYKVWPSAYASGALVKCRKKGASNWGSKSESIEEKLYEKWSQEYKRSIDCSNPKGFSQKAHCAGRKKNEDRHPNDVPYGPETKPTMPQGTVRVDVSDVYDWYKLGQNISNLDRTNTNMYGKGPPSTIMAFGSEEEEHKYIKDLEKLGLTTTDIDPIDPKQPKNMPRQKVDPTFNVAENFADGRNPQDKGDSARHGIPKKASLASLDKIVHSKTASPRKKQLAHWQANMRRGREK